MAVTLPFLTSYDPPGSSEGTLDPLGLYQIADQLAMQLVPAVRERMQRIRFLTAMAVGALVTEGMEDNSGQRDSAPYLVWEWLLVEALVREMEDISGNWGVPGTLVTRRALENYGYLDTRSYLKTPRIFGFNGVYKRLAMHLGIVDVHLDPGPNAERLVDVWARDLGMSGIEGARTLLSRWTTAVARSLKEKPPHTSPGWSKQTWKELADSFAPGSGKTREKRFLRDLLLSTDERRLGALPTIWNLQDEFTDEDFREEALHNLLEEREPSYTPILKAIRAYEQFARNLQDAFDVLKAQAAFSEAEGFSVPTIAKEDDFVRSVKGLDKKFEATYRALGVLAVHSASIQNLFGERFNVFAETLDPGECAQALCAHHEAVQKAKSAEGKRAWFDRIGPERIYVRHQYREPRREIQPGVYVHTYRGLPIRRFYKDLL